MKRKILFFASLLAMMQVHAQNQEYTDAQGVKYRVNSVEAFVADGTSAITDNIVIPDFITYEGIDHPVKTIDPFAFNNSTSLKSILIPNTVTGIGQRAFGGCTNLTTITIPRSVTVISIAAFHDCNGITDVYCYADPTKLYLEIPEGHFKSDGSTKFHVFDKSAWADKGANVILEDDLAEQTSNVAGNEVSGVYWSTYYSNAGNRKADANTTVYKAKVSGTKLILEEIADKVINEGQAVILESTNATTTLTPQAAASAADYTDNDLKGVGSAIAKNATYNYYVLSNGTSGLGFYKYAGALLGTRKAFVTQTADANEFFLFDNETTSVSETVRVKGEPSAIATEWYTLSGVKLSQQPTTKGVYIVNGRKALVK